MTISAQGFCFPHLADYNVKTQITLQENKQQKIISFDSDLEGYIFKMYFIVKNGVSVRCNQCPITGYCVWIRGEGKETTVTIQKSGGEKEKQKFIQITGEAFLSYFDGGYLTIIKYEGDYYCSWVEYTK